MKNRKMINVWNTSEVIRKILSITKKVFFTIKKLTLSVNSVTMGVVKVNGDYPNERL